ncbi:hypothetical protein [Chamaesiphon minutus]|uniref:Uncharacterized protein n=1 Tax=Chamaesiphon minutus (strain ATCC 27169 / PCC 6605) TaxID=1173020 RepID=K9UH84_CHAP6|nr:hypothetical protein [Chamaesiphon minutus]AFY94175.1 hypothetical protein Cha6605_3161 [Chamaesiphon minutus PCC 6605]
MQKSILNLSISIALLIIGCSQAAFAQQTTIRTGPYGNSSVTNRSYNGNGKQTTTRTGPYGNSSVTNRTFTGAGKQTTTRTGPYGKTGTTTRSVGK